MSISDFIGIGMGSPGTVDNKLKEVIGAYNLNWNNRQNVGKYFEEAFHLPFYIDNDANIAALGEQWKGAGNNEQDVIMITLGTGVGGGIVINGRLVQGKMGAAGEIGHITVDPESQILCTCGKKGCLEAVASATGIINIAREYAERYVGESIIKTRVDNGEVISSKDIFDCARNGDYFSEQIVERFSYYLGLACSHLINTLNPSVIVLGGGVSQAGEYLCEKVKKYSKEFTFPPLIDSTNIVLAELGTDAGIIGATKLVQLGEELY